MSLKEIPLFSALTDRMKWLSARQKVLSQNIANSDTPGYEAKDLKEQSFKEMVAKSSGPTMNMSTTSEKHIVTSESGEFRPKANVESYEVTPQGNAIVLEEQVMKLTETQIEYQMTTSLYKKQIGMLKTALGRGR